MKILLVSEIPFLATAIMALTDVLYLVVLLIIAVVVRLIMGQMFWHRDIKRFVTAGNYTMHYQPVVLSDRIVALEALICLPEEFIRDGLNKDEVIGYIDRHAINYTFAREVFCTVLQDYIRHFHGAPAVIISINVPPIAVCCSDLVSFFLDTLREAGIPPGTFMLEITERTSIPSKGLFIQNLKRLQRGGFLLAIDDAGRGLSKDIIALRFPFDYVKVEVSILKEEHVRRTESPFWTAVQDARRGIIVERIETARDVKLAQTLCRHPLQQGWFWWRAMTAEEAAALLSENKVRAGADTEGGHCSV
ncbi:EAL domain-containing protein [Phytobacter diazotrophicus]|uniref:EAL domain-containing protein n=1 Tax=Enterobacteriaceae TaxID=543 RepID=UPI001C98FE9B|nr:MULTISPECIES: EAL domain-containing protein [Enterobacteriaceae]MBY6257781.1 EAL domain-containing protein [Phytobacter diazotrophicus]